VVAVEAAGEGDQFRRAFEGREYLDCECSERHGARRNLSLESQGQDAGFAISDSRRAAACIAVGAEALRVQVVGRVGDSRVPDAAEGIAGEESAAGGVSAWRAVGTRLLGLRHICAVPFQSWIRGAAAEFPGVHRIWKEVSECRERRSGAARCRTT
jgi:hypothetical protein